MQIYVPSKDPEDWKSLLAQPDRHWKAGHSAMALARCWEHYKTSGWPPEIDRAFPAVNPIFAIPEFQVRLPGGDRPSQSDLFILAEQAEGPIVIMIEGKVNEPFGPTLDERRSDPSPGVRTRIDFLLRKLNLPADIPGTIRYQLLHRTVSAILAAEQFNAVGAAMIVHSFSQEKKWYEDFAAFVRLFGMEPQEGVALPLIQGADFDLWAGWCQGEARFLQTA